MTAWIETGASRPVGRSCHDSLLCQGGPPFDVVMVCRGTKHDTSGLDDIFKSTNVFCGAGSDERGRRYGFFDVQGSVVLRVVWHGCYVYGIFVRVSLCGSLVGPVLLILVHDSCIWR